MNNQQFEGLVRIQEEEKRRERYERVINKCIGSDAKPFSKEEDLEDRVIVRCKLIQSKLCRCRYYSESEEGKVCSYHKYNNIKGEWDN